MVNPKYEIGSVYTVRGHALLFLTEARTHTRKTLWPGDPVLLLEVGAKGTPNENAFKVLTSSGLVGWTYALPPPT